MPTTWLDLLAEHGLNPTLASDGREIIIHCSLCDHPSPKFYVNAAEGQWTCFHCHESGSAYDLCRQVLDLDHFRALRLVAKIERAGPSGRSRRRSPQQQPAPKAVELPEEHHLLTTHGAAGEGAFWRYLNGRGVSVGDVHAYRLGYCLRGRYAYRIIIPVTTSSILKTFVARTIGDGEPKVLYPEGARPSEALFGLDELCPEGKSIIIVEGAFDAIRLGPMAVATLGANLSEYQRRLLRARGIRRTILLWDGDEAGRDGAAKIADQLQAGGFDVSVALLPKGEDPASAAWQQIQDAITQAQAPGPYLSQRLSAHRLASARRTDLTSLSGPVRV